MNRGPKFNKRSQLFIRVYNVTAFRRRDAHQQSRSFSRHDPAPKTATYSDCVAVLQRASQKRNSQSQPRNDSATRLLCNWRLNLFVFSDLRSRHTSWHAACIKRWCEHNQYYEQQIRIHLRPTSPVGRKRSRRSRDCSLCGLYSECRLLNLAVRADARDSPSAWN